MKTQKELKELYRQEVEKIEKNKKYIDYLVKDAEYIFEFAGKLYKIERPRIKKEFCYSHGFSGITSDEEKREANDMVKVARTNKEYFKDENLKDLLKTVEKLEEAKKQAGYNWAEGSGPEYRIESCAKWGREDGGHILREWYLVHRYRYEYEKEPSGEVMPIEFIDELLRGYAVVLVCFEKRIDKKLKKNGLSKVRSWSYLSD